MATFRHNENEIVRVPKLNGLEGRVVILEAGGGGGSTLIIDGGSASNTGTPYMAIDGGSA